jgi:hypothetical protein
MASESADQALSPAVTSFVIYERTWKLGGPIYSTGVGAIKKKMAQSFGDACATAQVDGVCMGCGSCQKYLAKWTDLSEELISEYSGNHRLFQDPSKELPPKDPKFHGPQSFSRHAEGSSSAVLNMADGPRQ